MASTVTRKIVLTGIILLLFANLALADDWDNLTTSRLDQPGIGGQPTTTATTGGHGCYDSDFEGDAYCLETFEDDYVVKVTNKSIATNSLGAMKTKMLESISEDYFKQHFDIKRVIVDIRAYDDFNDSGIFYPNEIDSWPWLADIRLEYNVDGYRFYYGADVRYKEGKTDILQLNRPREIENLIDRSTVFSEARKCTGRKDVAYHYGRGIWEQDNPTLVAEGTFSGDNPSGNLFEIIWKQEKLHAVVRL